MGNRKPWEVAEGWLRARGEFKSGELSEQTGISRQGLHRHLTRWLAEGLIVREGTGRGTRYRRKESAPFERSFPTRGLEEAEVWLEVHEWVEAAGPRLTPEAAAVLQYVLTEILNNAIDHSAAPELSLRVEAETERIGINIGDEGIGAFERLRDRLQLDDHLHALQELSKGKVTTWPERHTGEGIFFASKLVDRFELEANGLVWVVDNERGDQAIREERRRPGTTVRTELSPTCSVPPEELFRRYTHDFEFDTTRCVVHLFEKGVDFVSRSEAKRLTSGLERFAEVILDFHGVESVGQGFVDEVFRVWAKDHPEVRLTPERMNRAVDFMVRRGLPRMR